MSRRGPAHAVRRRFPGSVDQGLVGKRFGKLYHHNPAGSAPSRDDNSQGDQNRDEQNQGEQNQPTDY
jgi:hypothetical protein